MSATVKSPSKTVSQVSLPHSNVSLSRPVSRQSSGGRSSSLRKQNSSLSGSFVKLEPIPPEHLRPHVRSAVRRWKKGHEDGMIVELLATRDQVKNDVYEARKKVSRIARRIPVEILAKEWLNLERASIETRAFLIDSLFPTVILGLEKLLEEVQKRSLTVDDSSDPNFNPINFLAQYLMRNNPKYSNFSEASPYIHGLRAISEELRQEIYTFKDNKLALLKANAKRKKEERERELELRREEYNRKQQAIADLFNDFLVGDEIRIDYVVLQRAIKSFTDVVLKMPKELHPYLQMVLELQVSDEDGKKMGKKDFSEYFFQFIDDMPYDVFEQFRDHLRQCAHAYKKQAEKELRRVMLSNVFISCDQDEIGLLDRPRILDLFEIFYDKSTDYTKSLMRNPRQWPIREYQEVLHEVEEKEQAIIDHVQEELRDVMENEVDPDDLLYRSEESSLSIREESSVVEHGDRNMVSETVDIPKEVVKGDVDLENSDNREVFSEVEKKSNGLGDVKESVVAHVTENVEEQKSEIDSPKVEEQKSEIDSTKVEEQKSEIDSPKLEEQKSEVDSPKVEEQKSQIVLSKNEGHKSEVDATKDEEQKSEVDSTKVEEQKPEVDSTKVEEQTSEVDSTKVVDKIADVDEPLDKDDAILQSEGFTDTSLDGTKLQFSDEKRDADSDAAVDQSLETIVGDDVLVTSDEKNIDDGEKTKLKREVTFEDSVIQREIEKDKSDPVAHSESEPSNKEEGVSGDLYNVTQASEEEALQNFEREATGLSVLTSRTVSTPFDEQNLSQNQFVRLAENFLGEEPQKETVEQLSNFLREGYVETEEERLARIKLVQKRQLSAKRKVMMDELFILWDNDASGYLDLDEVEAVILKFRDGILKKGTVKARKEIKHKTKHHDNRLSKREFRDYLKAIHSSVNTGDPNIIEECIHFLSESVQRSYEDKIRGQARKKWLVQIRLAGEQSGASMEPVYRAVFQALYKDAETHGDGKRISANVSILDSNVDYPEKGSLMLKFVAATPEDADFVVGQVIYEKDEVGISFQVVSSGKPCHFPRIQTNYESIRFFNTLRGDDEKEGALVVVPLKDRQKRVFGTIGVDTLSEPMKRKIFSAHEIQFYQGIANAFSISYHTVEGVQKTIRVAETALSWICRRVNAVTNVTLYLKELDRKVGHGAYCLRKVLHVNNDGEVEKYRVAPRLMKNENVFRDYLFICMDNSETVSADAYGEHHIASPLRDLDQTAMAVLDISIGKLSHLDEHDQNELLKILRLLQQAQDEIRKRALGEPGQLDLHMSAEALFNKFMLEDLRNHVALLTKEAYAEMRSYQNPPATIHNIIRAVLSIFHSDEAMSGQFDKWQGCQKYVKLILSKEIIGFDPQQDADKVPLEYIETCLTSVSPNAAKKHGSRPTEYLFNWLVMCVNMARHSIATNQYKKPMGPPMPTLAEEPTELETTLPDKLEESRQPTIVDNNNQEA